MKVNDIIYRFPSNDVRDGICRLRTFINNDKAYALLTDLGIKNLLNAIGNSIEIICQSLISKMMVPNDCVFIVHYEPTVFEEHTFYIIEFSDEAFAKWKHISIEEVKLVLNCELTEMDNLTLENERLIGDIERLRTIINPYLDLPIYQTSETIVRRIEIEDQQLSKKYLLDVVNSGASERELQNIIKKDLSIFGELYSSPPENYMCFSEFPIGNGVVDFVLFTGISRMDVFCIEIKGAEFNLFNKTGYKDFNSKMDSGIKQIRDRLGFVYRNLSEFGKEVHEVRKSVLKGGQIYNSFIGPDKEILVDENKDIRLHFVVIGGRTQNDLEESKKRNDFESTFMHPIKIESWDTILRKLRRK